MAMPKLRIVRGPFQGREFPLSRPLTTIGRTPENDIFIPDISVSRLHAVIALRDGGVVFFDKSRNGILVNGKFHSQHQLQPGDTLEIGPCLFTFC